MSIIREKIKFVAGQDTNIKFTIGGNDNFLGFQQEIDRYTTYSTANSINDTQDVEVRRYSFVNPTDKTTAFAFYFWGGSSYSASYYVAGFNGDDINLLSDNYLNSYFALDFYDTFDPNTQQKIFTAYFTKLGESYISWLPILSGNQTFKMSVPIDYLSTFSGNTVSGYSRFSFYNAKTGKIQLFYNYNNRNLTTPERLYVKMTFNKLTHTWEIDPSALSDVLNFQQVFLYEMKYDENQQYLDRYNDTFENYDNLKQVFPTGNTFNFETGKYEAT